MKKAITITTLVAALLMITGTATAAETQEFSLWEQTYGDTDIYESDYDIQVTPKTDEVTYEVDFPKEATEVDVEVSTADGNYHIKNDGGNNNFYYKKPSKNGKKESVANFEKFKGGSYEDGKVTFTVTRDINHDQSFSAHLMGNFEGFNSAVTKKVGNTRKGSFYDDSSTDHHQTLEFDEIKATQAEVNVPEDFMSFEVDTSSLEFGTVYPGFNSPVREIAMKNTGSKDIQIAPKLDAPEDSVFNHLYFNYQREGKIGGLIGNGKTEIDREVLCTRPEAHGGTYSLLEHPDTPCDTTKDGYSYEFESDEIGLETQLKVPDDYQGDGEQTGKIYYIGMPN